MGKQTTKRERLKKRRQREQMRSRIIWTAAIAFVTVTVGALVWPSLRPVVGEAVAIMADSSHVTTGEDPGPFNSDPPTSGTHYAESLQAGMYDEAAAEAYDPYPAGYLVHNLEHGYVIFWYNCAFLEDAGCEVLKGQLQDVIDEAEYKVIAFPWASIDVPVVATSWGRMQAFENFDPGAASQFVKRNRNHAPEPQAP